MAEWCSLIPTFSRIAIEVRCILAIFSCMLPTFFVILDMAVKITVYRYGIGIIVQGAVAEDGNVYLPL